MAEGDFDETSGGVAKASPERNVAGPRIVHATQVCTGAALLALGIFGVMTWQSAAAEYKADGSFQIAHATSALFFGLGIGLMWNVLLKAPFFRLRGVVRVPVMALTATIAGVCVFGLAQIHSARGGLTAAAGDAMYDRALPVLGAAAAFGIGYWVGLLVDLIAHAASFKFVLISIVTIALSAVFQVASSGVNIWMLVHSKQICRFGPLVKAQANCGGSGASTAASTGPLVVVIVAGVVILADILVAIIAGVATEGNIFRK